MFQFVRPVEEDFTRRRRFAFDAPVNLCKVSIPLMIGILFGSLIGAFSTAPQPVMALFEFRLNELDFLRGLWHCIRFPFFAIVLSTTFLGVVMIPALSCFRGFLLGCSVAAAFQSGQMSGLLISALTFGIPALFDLPAFLIVASDSLSLSEIMLDAVLRKQYRHPFEQCVSVHALAIMLLCMIETMYDCLLLPAIL